jgi:hypothetical protein
MRPISVLVASALLAGCSGSSANATSGSAGSCASGDAVLATGIDPNNTDLAVSNDRVVYRTQAGSPISTTSTATLASVPLAGGPSETIADANILAFAVGPTDAVAWATQGAPTALAGGAPEALHLRDASGTTQDIDMPSAAQGVRALALDGYGNLFVLFQVAIQGIGSGVSVYRWSAQRKAFDELHRAPSMGTFAPDGTGMAWVGPVSGTAGVALYSEDPTGGAPTIGPELPSGVTFVGLDASKVYVVDTTAAQIFRIESVDRQTKTSATAFTFPAPRPAQPSDIVVDDSSFYWLAHDAQTGDAKIFRAPKTGGDPEVFAHGSELGPPRIGGCRVAFAGVPDGGGAWSIMTRPR